MPNARALIQVSNSLNTHFANFAWALNAKRFTRFLKMSRD